MGIRCCICDAVDQWENVDEFRFKQKYFNKSKFNKVTELPYNMSMCKSCGFITYPDRIDSEEKLIEFYRQDYRKPPNVSAMFTGQRKLHFHGEFLKELFKEWQEKKVKPTVLEIGAAFGMVLNWVRKAFPEAELHGTEITRAYRRVAYYLYSLNLTEEYDLSVENDLILHYKVLEHQIDPDKKLRQLALTLKPGGHIYLSVPTWFNRLSNFGDDGFDLEHYYHPNHINTWSQKNFETLLKKCGLKIVKENQVFYSSTYLLQRDDSLMDVKREYDNPDEIRKNLKLVKEAYLAYTEGRFEDCIKAWPNFPMAHLSAYENNRNAFHKEGFEAIKSKVIDRAIQMCPNDPVIACFVGDLYRRYDMWEDSISWFNESLKLRPNDVSALIQISQNLRIMASKTEEQVERWNLLSDAAGIMMFLRDSSFQNQYEAITWLMDDYSNLPLPGDPNGTEWLEARKK